MTNDTKYNSLANPTFHKFGSLPAKDQARWINPQDILLLATEGLDFDQIAIALNVKPNSVKLNLDRNGLMDKFKEIRGKYLSSKLESSLVELAQGAKSEESIETWTDVDPTTGLEKEYTKKVKKLPPDMQAIKVLARKYNVGFSDLVQEEDTGRVTININSRSLSLKEKLSILSGNSPILVESTVIDEEREKEILDL